MKTSTKKILGDWYVNGNHGTVIYNGSLFSVDEAVVDYKQDEEHINQRSTRRSA